MTASDHYRVLGVPPTASDEEIRTAHRFKVLAFHPDRFSGASEQIRRRAEEELRAVNEAFAVLSDRGRRAEYDRARVARPADRADAPPTSAPIPSWLQRIPRWVIVVAALIYLLSPFDLIPEFALPFGLLDDLILVLIVIYLLRAGRPPRL